jgi:hypothetical protein
MRATRFASLLSVSLAVFPACDDIVLTPITPDWLEWSDSAVAGAPFGIHVRGINDAYPSNLRIEVHVAGDTVTIVPYMVIAREHPFGRNVGVLRPLPWYDTLVWVPAFSAATARTVVIRAPSGWHAGVPPWPVRTFGTITVSVDTPVAPHMRSVGVGSGFQDSFGCYLVNPASIRQRYVSADQPPAWAPGFSGLVYGRIDPVLRSTCLDDAYVIQVDSIIQ